MNPDKQEPILFSPPSLGPLELERLTRVVRSGWLTTGPETTEFEKRFGDTVGSESSLAVNSCTSALLLALHALDVGKDDEVITTTITFASTANVIEHVGATPVIVDVEPDTMNIDPQEVERRITDKTKAMIVVHYAGHPVDLDAIDALCRRRGIGVIEDAAHALPARYGSTMIGGTGNLTAFSFYATKNLTTGEGGMLTGPADLVDRARTLSLHGMSRNAWNRYGEGGRWHYDIVDAGFKCNMGDLQAALGLAQLERLPELQARRREIFDRYNAAFAGVPGLTIPTQRPNVEHALHLYVLRLGDQLAQRRDALYDHLQAERIGASVHFIPIHRHRFYREKYSLRAEDYAVAESCFARMLSLPMSPAHTDVEIDRVIESVVRFCNSTSRQAA